MCQYCCIHILLPCRLIWLHHYGGGRCKWNNMDRLIRIVQNHLLCWIFPTSSCPNLNPSTSHLTFDKVIIGSPQQHNVKETETDRDQTNFFFCGSRGSNPDLAYIMHCPYQLIFGKAKKVLEFIKARTELIKLPNFRDSFRYFIRDVYVYHFISVSRAVNATPRHHCVN
jgi:hypothetical protein